MDLNPLTRFTGKPVIFVITDVGSPADANVKTPNGSYSVLRKLAEVNPTNSLKLGYKAQYFAELSIK